MTPALAPGASVDDRPWSMVYRPRSVRSENMSNDIFVITEQLDGNIAEISFELVGKAKELAGTWGGQVVAVVLGSGVSANGFASDSTLNVDDPNLAQFNPEAYGKVIEALVTEKLPRLVM